MGCASSSPSPSKVKDAPPVPDKKAQAGAGAAELEVEITALKQKLAAQAACVAQTRRRLERERTALEAKYALFATFLGKNGGLPAEKVASLVQVPNVCDGGIKTQLVKKTDDDIGVGAAFCGRSVIMPLGVSELTSKLAASTIEICDLFVQCKANVAGNRDVFRTPEAVLHITLFATSSDPPGGELAPEALLASELASLKQLAAEWDAFELEAHSIIMMPSGTLLLLWLPVPASLTDAESTRREFEAMRAGGAFPNASGGVPNIFHTSLARVCFGCELSPEEIAQINAACEKASAAIRGTRLSFGKIWYVTDSDESAMVAPPPSTTTGVKRAWLTAANVVRNGDVVTIHLD